jgi:hypothetical protein
MLRESLTLFSIFAAQETFLIEFSRLILHLLQSKNNSVWVLKEIEKPDVLKHFAASRNFVLQFIKTCVPFLDVSQFRLENLHLKEILQGLSKCNREVFERELLPSDDNQSIVHKIIGENSDELLRMEEQVQIAQKEWRHERDVSVEKKRAVYAKLSEKLKTANQSISTAVLFLLSQSTKRDIERKRELMNKEKLLRAQWTSIIEILSHDRSIWPNCEGLRWKLDPTEGKFFFFSSFFFLLGTDGKYNKRKDLFAWQSN